MSIYYISTQNGTIYELDATLKISYRESGVITDNVIESGDSVADHYVNKPIMFSFNGGISDIKSISASNENSKSTEDYINGLRNLKVSKQPFTFHYGEKVGSFDNCFFESLEIAQDNTNGNVGSIDSFSISATIKQVRLAQRARLVPARDAGITSDNYQEQVKGSGTTEEPTAIQADNFQEGLSKSFGIPVETFTGGI